jgi:hypothetical protein
LRIAHDTCAVRPIGSKGPQQLEQKPVDVLVADRCKYDVLADAGTHCISSVAISASSCPAVLRIALGSPDDPDVNITSSTFWRIGEGASSACAFRSLRTIRSATGNSPSKPSACCASVCTTPGVFNGGMTGVLPLCQSVNKPTEKSYVLASHDDARTDVGGEPGRGEGATASRRRDRRHL